MPAGYLLDTNTCSYIIKGNRPHVREHLVKVPISEISISAVTEAELRFGVVRLSDAKSLKIAVEEFLRRVEILAWDPKAAVEYARLRTTLETAGQPIGNLDLMIAAQAASIDAVLVTSDRVFRRIHGLTIEDWTKA